MKLVKVNGFSELNTGDKIRCVIDASEITDCAVFIGNGKYYLCQNVRNGNDCGEENKQGYDYSWQIADNAEDDDLETELSINCVTGLRKIVKGES